MSKDIIPIFTSDGSISKSILTSDESAEIKDDAPVSIWSIAKEFNIDPVVILETSMVNFISHYKNAQKLGKQLIFGCRFRIVNDNYDLSEDSMKTESCVSVFMKNSNGYRDLIRLYSAINANKDTFYYYPRGSWKLLQKYWTDNLLMLIPFYSSFITKNTLNYGYRCVPEFGKIRPVFVLESHELPFDEILREKTIHYANENKLEVIEGSSIYYFKDSDSRQYQVFRAIHERSSFQKPELSYFCQNTFSHESYLKRINE